MGLMNVALIEENTIVNVIVCDTNILWRPPGEYEILDVDSGVSIGWTKVDGTWTPPEDEV